MKESTPPLLRGTGVLVVLLSTTVALVLARRDTPPNAAVHDSHAATEMAAAQPRAPGDGEEESFVDEVVTNRGFEWGGFCGTLMIAGSFYAEAYLRWRK